jgi:hypothetical protein
MRNDVHPPPIERPSEPAKSGRGPVMVSVGSNGDGHPAANKPPIPPPDKLIADVSLYDHPNFEPSGAGNFWVLALIGIGIFAVVALVVVTMWIGKHV